MRNPETRKALFSAVVLTAATLCTSSSERHENTTLTEVSTAGKKDVKGVASVRTQLSTRTAVCVDE